MVPTLGKLVILTDSGFGSCDVINDAIKFSLSNGYICATDRPIDFVFDPTVGFSGRRIEWTYFRLHQIQDGGC